MIGLYIHTPFCIQKCPYCDFYSLPMSESAADSYATALCRAIKSAPQALPQRKVVAPGYGNNCLFADTIYFGGGTPTVFGTHRILQVLECIRKYFHISENAEITIEANPATCTQKDFQNLCAAGVNRISFGVQSMHDAELRLLERPHTAHEAIRAIEDAHKAGFERISADLMLAIPGQTTKSLKASIKALGELAVDHISAYILKIEDGTPFAKQEMSKLCPDEDASAKLYLECVDELQLQGFSQYEISNFAKSGGKSQHNLKYWKSEPYLGIGPGAFSFYGGERFHFQPDLAAFNSATDPFTLCVSDGVGGDFEEYAMLRLRLSAGLNLNEVKRLYPYVDTAKIKVLAKQLVELAECKSQIIQLTPRGFLVSNAVIAHLLGY